MTQRRVETVTATEKSANIPLSPNIHILFLPTDLHTFPLRIRRENLIKDQGIFSLVSILLLLITISLANVWISLGEN